MISVTTVCPECQTAMPQVVQSASTADLSTAPTVTVTPSTVQIVTLCAACIQRRITTTVNVRLPVRGEWPL